MFCQNCGTNLPDGTKFCRDCGAPRQVQALPTKPMTSQDFEVSAPPKKEVSPVKLAVAALLLAVGPFHGFLLNLVRFVFSRFSNYVLSSIGFSIASLVISIIMYATAFGLSLSYAVTALKAKQQRGAAIISIIFSILCLLAIIINCFYIVSNVQTLYYYM